MPTEYDTSPESITCEMLLRGSTHRGDAPSSPIEWQDHWQWRVLLSQLSSKKSNKQHPLTSLIDSHWASHADQVSLLCFVLFDQEETLRQGGAAATGSTKERSDFEMISCHRLVSMWSNTTLCWLNWGSGLIVKKWWFLISNQLNRHYSHQCFYLWQRVPIHFCVVIVLYDLVISRSWWRDGIVIVRPSLIHAVS